MLEIVGTHHIPLF